MRSAYGFGSLTPTVTGLLIVIIANYLVFAIFGNTAVGAQIYQALMLSPREVISSFALWQLITYGFLHDIGSPLHVIFNALVLYMMGPQLEERFGEKRFLIFVMISILLGGIFVTLAYYLGISSSVVVGFSAATLGLVIAWGLSFPNLQIFLLGIVPLSGKQLVYVTIGLEILYAVSTNSIASAAHFGGIVAGFIFTLGLFKPRRIKELWRKSKNQWRR